MRDDTHPACFSDMLAHNKPARDAYARLSPSEKCRVLARAGHIRGEDTLQLYTMSLSNETRADESF